METSHNRKPIEPLPGVERRGTSGADAGRSSMQTVSDSLLNRRAGVGEPEDSTADQRGGEGAGDALQNRAQPTDFAGSSAATTNKKISNDKRRKWSNEELLELMFCYYKAKAEGAGYLARLQELFTERNPNNPKIHKFNGNTLSTQARTVLKHNVISQQLLDQVQKEAEGVTFMENSEPILNDEQIITSTQTSSIQHITHQTQHTTEQAEIIDELTRNIEVNEDQDPLILQFLQILAETNETLIEERPLLPKAKINKRFIDNLNLLNNYLPKLLITNNSLREVNNIIYATAKTLIVNNNQMPYTPKNTLKPKSDPPWKKRLHNKIEKFRKELGQLVEIQRGVNTRKMAMGKASNQAWTRNHFESSSHVLGIDIAPEWSTKINPDIFFF